MSQLAVQERPQPQAVYEEVPLPATVSPSGRPIGGSRSGVDVAPVIKEIDQTLVAASAGSLGVNGIATETAELRFAASDTSAAEVDKSAGLPDELAREKYNRSLRAYRSLGSLARTGRLRTESGRAARERVRRDLITSLAEMFENGAEFSGRFEISDVYEYGIIDDEVQYMAADGPKSMHQIILDGAMVSEAASKTDPLMIPQALRDKADGFNSSRVNEIAAGRVSGINTRMVVSRDLGEIIKPGSPHRELYLGKGYREGLSFIQLYYAEGDAMTTGTFSVDGVSDGVFDTILARHGVAMPAGESRHNSVKYGIEITLPSKSAAVAFVRQFRRDCYALQGDTRERCSVSQFMKERTGEIDGYIDALCVPLSLSIDSRMKDPVIHSFVENLLRKPGGIKAEVVRHLHRIQESDAFNDDDGRLLSGIIMYAVAEALYDEARSFSGKEHKPTEAVRRHYRPLLPEQIIMQLADGVHIGVQAQRKHGGSCPGSVDIGIETDSAQLGIPQEAFGGRRGKKQASDEDDKSNWEWKHGVCKVQYCPTRPSMTEVGPCDVCRGCQHKYDNGQDPVMLYAKKGMLKHKLEGGDHKIKWIGTKKKSKKEPESKHIA